MNFSNRAHYALIPALIGALIFVATCLWTPSNLPPLSSDIPWDKVVHFLMFLILSGASLIYYYKLHRSKPLVWKWIFWGFIVPIIYGGIIELMQGRIFPGRSSELADFVADVLGSTTAMLFAFYYYRKSKKSKNNLSL